MTRLGPPSAAEYLAIIDTWNAETQRLCSEQPEQAAVRQALLHAEKRTHERGWDGPPEVFTLGRHRGKVHYSRQDEFTSMVRDLPQRPPATLEAIAAIMEAARTEATQGGMTDDLITNRQGAVFQGIGFMFEGWMVLGTDSVAANKYTDALAKEHLLKTHPDRREVRIVSYAARDGYVWDVQRFRRQPDLALPRYTRVLTQDDDDPTAGSVPRSLTRMCNAIASNPVPLASYGEIV
jgi:hypothetical protein